MLVEQAGPPPLWTAVLRFDVVGFRLASKRNSPLDFRGKFPVAIT